MTEDSKASTSAGLTRGRESIIYHDFESTSSLPISGSFRASGSKVNTTNREKAVREEEDEVVIKTKTFTTPYDACPSKELTFTALVAGDEDGDTATKELVVCWHGYPDTHHTWEPLMKHLTKDNADSKYIVVAPKLPGYEETTHLGRGCYSMLEVAQAMMALHEVLLKKYEKREFHYVGHDWGGVAGQMVCQLDPSVVKSYTNVAVPFWARFYVIAIFQYPQQILNLWYIIFLQLPVIPQLVLRLNNFRFLDKRWREWSPGTNGPAAKPEESTLKYYWDLVKEQFQNRLIFLNAIDYYRCLIRGVFMLRPKAWKTTKIIMGYDPRYPALAKDGGFPVPIYSIFGADDGCIMKECVKATHANRKGDFPKGLNMTIMENTGHWLHIEKPDLVNRRIARFLKTLSIDTSRRDSCTVS